MGFLSWCSPPACTSRHTALIRAFSWPFQGTHKPQAFLVPLHLLSILFPSKLPYHCSLLLSPAACIEFRYLPSRPFLFFYTHTHDSCPSFFKELNVSFPDHRITALDSLSHVQTMTLLWMGCLWVSSCLHHFLVFHTQFSAFAICSLLVSYGAYSLAQKMGWYIPPIIEGCLLDYTALCSRS